MNEKKLILIIVLILLIAFGVFLHFLLNQPEIGNTFTQSATSAVSSASSGGGGGWAN